MNYGKIAVVGAGLSGASAAAALAGAGYKIRVFEKSRGMGGRMATRRSSGLEFDHGAQYFTVTDQAFREEVDGWMKSGLAAPWEARLAVFDEGTFRLKHQRMVRYVGTPRMNSIARELLKDIEVVLETKIDGIARFGNGWKLISENRKLDDPFDTIIMAIPPAQAREILGPFAESFQGKLDTVMDACWAVMASFDAPLDLDFDAGFVNGSPLSWIARNSTKPGRSSRECWILHGSRQWSREHVESEPGNVKQELLAEFSRLTGIDPAAASWATAHRWRYAQAPEPLTEGCLWNPELGLGVCGDWCRGSRVEGAFLSGREMARKINGY